MKASNSFNSDASFSSCGLYRWSLKRSISNNKSSIIFIGLNPSRASLSIDDPTLRRILKFSFSWGYGSLIVINLFARISCSPGILRRCSNPIGKKNDEELSNWIVQWAKNPLLDLWLGWGNQGAFKNRHLEVMSWLKKNAFERAYQYPSAFGPLALGLTSKGHPRHPLYLSNKEVLRPFELI